jgi:beta-phosphoglucomutase
LRVTRYSLLATRYSLLATRYSLLATRMHYSFHTTFLWEDDNLRDKVHAVVWDLDGVIVDSGDAHNQSWQEMANDLGLPYDPDKDFKAIFGKHNTDIIKYLWDITNPEQVERIANSKETHFREEAAQLKPLPGVVELVKALSEAGWRQAIGSSAPLENVSLLLSATGLWTYMQAISSGNDVTNGKPDPEVFLIAFERLGADPVQGVVIEDAPAGVQAGKRAGAAVLGVTTTQTRQTLLDAGADMVADSLAEVTIADLQNLVASNI